MIDFNALAADIGHCLDQALSPDALPDVPASLLEPMRYALLGGGKRIRPILCVLSAEAAGGSAERAMPAALAIETLHNYTLVHDDLPCMDDDLLRRGRPTVHAKYGYGQAVLVGDALQALAFRFLSRLDLPASAFREALAEFARAAGPDGVVGGQWLDVTTAPSHDAGRIGYVHLHKTADLFIASATLGAIVADPDGGPGSPARVALAAFARHLGIAFQIADDLLDEPERLAKPVAERELSCLDIWTPEEAQNRLAAHTRESMDSLDALPGPTAPLRDLADALLHRRT